MTRHSPPTPQLSSLTSTSTASTPAAARARTSSALSPFFTRLDDSNATAPSLRFSTVSSFASNPDPPRPITPRPLTPLSIDTSTAYEPDRDREPVSWSAFARRQWSRVSHLANDDADSVVSEPASFSNAAYVASDLWLVQRDVPPAETHLAERRRRRERCSQSYDHQRDPTEWKNDDHASSKLINLFFSGRNTPTVGPTRRDREDVAPVRIARGYPERRPGDRRFTGRTEGIHGGYARFGTDDGRVPLKKTPYGGQFQEQDFGPFVRRRFSRARKFRWWLRKVTNRVRNDWEYNM